MSVAASLRLLAVAVVLTVSVTSSAHAASATQMPRVSAAVTVVFDDDPGDIDPDAFITRGN